MFAIAQHGGLNFRRRTGQDGGNLRAGLEQAGRLAVNHLEIALFRGVRIVRVHELQDLSLGDLVRGIGHHPHDPGQAQGHHHLEGAGIEVIAHEDAGFVAPDSIGGFPATAQVRAIDDVVVEEGGCMDEFDDGRGFGMPGAAISASPGCNQHDQRA